MKKNMSHLYAIILAIALFFCIGSNNVQAQEGAVISGGNPAISEEGGSQSGLGSEESQGKEESFITKAGWNEYEGQKYYANEDLSIFKGWLDLDGKRFYLNPENNGAAACDITLEIEGNTYHFNEKCEMVTRWKKLNNKWYYFEESGAMAKNQWVRDSVDWCYVGKDGYCLTNNWVLDSKGWRYVDSNGRIVKNQWKKDSVDWCYLKNDGYCMTNSWKKDSIDWCYLGSNGRIARNQWAKDSVDWCYVGKDGYCLTNNWVLDSRGWRYVGADGRIEKNKWKKDSVDWCYLGKDGYCDINCWKTDSKGWCYMGSNGRMARNQWAKDSVGWCYLDSNGRITKNQWVKDSVDWCYVGKDGYCVNNSWQKDSAGWCYLDASGRIVKGWQFIDQNWYYFNSQGRMVTGKYQIDGKWYYFTSQGKWYEPDVFSIDVIKDKVSSEISKYSGSIGVYFEDLSTGQTFILNDQSMYPCSIIKMTTMASVYNEINLGNLSYSKCSNDLWNMMVYSDNTAYNSLMAKIGQGNPVEGSRRLNSFLRDNGINKTAANNGLLPGNGYFTSGVRNYTCPSDIGRLLSKIYNRSIVSPVNCDKMIDLMSHCADDRALRGGLPSGTKFAHKSGWAYDFYHDGGIVYGPNRDYVLVVFTQGVSNYGRTFENISSLVYDYEKSVR